MVIASYDHHLIHKYKRTDKLSVDWTKDGQIEITNPFQIQFIDNNLYVPSAGERIYCLSNNQTEDKVLLHQTQKTRTAVVLFNGVLCVYIKGQKEVLRIKGREKQEPLQIPSGIGNVHTLCKSNVLLISGSKGFIVFDQNFDCIYQQKMNERHAEVLFAHRHDEEWTFLFGDGDNKRLITTHIQPREYHIPLSIREELK